MKTELNSEQESFLDEAVLLGNWTLNSETGLVDVDGGVVIDDGTFDMLPVRFGEVTGRFVATNLGLTTLEGSPHTVGDSFSCMWNKLTSLKGGPKSVGNGIGLFDNPLMTLEGFPDEIQGVTFIGFGEIDKAYMLH